MDNVENLHDIPTVKTRTTSGKSKKSGVEEISFVPPRILNVYVELIGDGILVTHRWGAKNKKALMKSEVKSKVKEPRDPERDFNEARCIDPITGKDGFPANALKEAIKAATRFAGGTAATAVKGSVFVVTESESADADKDIIPFTQYAAGDDGRPFMREDIVRVGKFPNKQPDLRWRPEYRHWKATAHIRMDASIITFNQLMNLLYRAGQNVGLCENRPNWGRFKIGKVTVQEETVQFPEVA